MAANVKYFEYLKGRSILGLIYKKIFLYPKLSKLLEAQTLDIGCGVGDFLKFRKNSIGVDINQDCVDWCIDQGLNAKHMKMDELPFQDDFFDSVILDNVLEHIENPDPLLDEISRVLRNKGVLIIGVPGLKGYAYDDDHKKFYTKDQLVKILDSHDYINEKIFGMPFDIDFLSNKMRQYCVYCRFVKNT